MYQEGGVLPKGVLVSGQRYLKGISRAEVYICHLGVLKGLSKHVEQTHLTGDSSGLYGGLRPEGVPFLHLQLH